MKKIAVIEKIHKDGLEIIDKDPDYEYELISDVSEENLKKKLPNFLSFSSKRIFKFVSANLYAKNNPDIPPPTITKS